MMIDYSGATSGNVKATRYTALAPIIRVREIIKVKYEMLIFHFYDLPHPNHRDECSIPCIFDITRGSSIVVTYSTADVRVTSDRPGNP